MTELKKLLDELAAEAKAYDVVDRAQKRARARRWVVPAAACAVAVVAAAGTATAIGLYDRPGSAEPLTQGTGTPTAAAAPATLPPALPAPTSCTAAQLPVPAGFPPKSLVSGGDPSGRYLVGRGYPSITNPGAPSYGALLWDNGEVTPLEVPGAEVAPADVNSSGEVITTSWLEAGGTAGFYYYEGVLTQLAGDNVEVSAISDDGAIVGFMWEHTEDPGANGMTQRQRPVVWHSATEQPEFVGPDDLEGMAVGIDDDGTITVYAPPGPAEPGANGEIVRVAKDGTVASVPLPDAPVRTGQVRGYNNGWILVNGDSGAAPYYAWHLLVGATHELPAMPDAVSAHGWVPISLNPIPNIGEQFSPVGTAFLLTADGVRVDLPPLTGTYSNYSLLPTYISDDGRTVAGQAIDPTYESPDADDVAVVWHCS